MAARSNRGSRWIARASVALLLSVCGISLAALPASTRWYNVQSLGPAIRHAPSTGPVIDRAILLDGVFGEANRWNRTALRFAYGVSSLFGHDNLGRSLLFRLLLAFPVSAAIGLAAAMIALVVGTLWGAIAGSIGGRTDWLMMRIVDVLYGLPYVLMVILARVALAPLLGQLFGRGSRIADVVLLLLAIGAVSWLSLARVVRGQVLALRSMGFVEAARLAGAGPIHILRRHVLPNVVGPVVAYATLIVPQAIMQEAFLSFLGIGIQQPLPSLGRLAADGVQAVNTFVGFWWLLVFPCGILTLTLLSLNYLSDALRDLFDPRSSAQPWV